MPDDSSGDVPTGPAYTELIPRPDPSKLTDEAIGRATVQYRREMDAVRQLLAERIATEIEARDRAVAGLRDVLERRVGDLDEATERRLGSMAGLPEQLKQDRAAALAALRELIETRLAAMDKATELLANDLRTLPSTLEERLKGLRELIGERIDGIDKATDLRLRVADNLPAQVTEQVDQLRALHEERFSSIAQQFAERDVRTSQAQQASDQALNAALQAAKELVNAQGEASSAAAVKSETSFTKQIDQIGTIISTLEKALDARITELKERIDRGEGTTSGSAAAVVGYRSDATYEQTSRLAAAAQSRAIIGSVIAGLAVLVALVSVILYATKKLRRPRHGCYPRRYDR